MVHALSIIIHNFTGYNVPNNIPINIPHNRVLTISSTGTFGYVDSVRESVIVAQGEISPGDIVLQVNGDAVGGFIHWDLLCEIRRSGSLLTLFLVPQGKLFANFP